MLTNIEFYISPDGSININEKGQPTRIFDEKCTEVVEELILMIRDLYPGAYSALTEMYKSSLPNKRFFEFKVVHRFIRCNFGEYDGLSFDIDGVGKLNFEHVACPMRGECKHEGVICRPAMQTDLTAKEREVAALLCEGYDRMAIAEQLNISPYTVIRHFANIRNRLGLKSTTQIITHFKDGLK